MFQSGVDLTFLLNVCSIRSFVLRGGLAEEFEDHRLWPRLQSAIGPSDLALSGSVAVRGQLQSARLVYSSAWPEEPRQKEKSFVRPPHMTRSERRRPNDGPSEFDVLSENRSIGVSRFGFGVH